MLTINDIINKCIDKDLEHNNFSRETALNYYATLSIENIMKIYKRYYENNKKEN